MKKIIFIIFFFVSNSYSQLGDNSSGGTPDSTFGKVILTNTDTVITFPSSTSEVDSNTNQYFQAVGVQRPSGINWTKYLRPSADYDTSSGIWKASSGLLRYAMIDEATLDTTDYVRARGGADGLQIKLSDTLVFDGYYSRSDSLTFYLTAKESVATGNAVFEILKGSLYLDDAVFSGAFANYFNAVYQTVSFKIPISAFTNGLDSIYLYLYYEDDPIPVSVAQAYIELPTPHFNSPKVEFVEKGKNVPKKLLQVRLQATQDSVHVVETPISYGWVGGFTYAIDDPEGIVIVNSDSSEFPTSAIPTTQIGIGNNLLLASRGGANQISVTVLTASNAGGFESEGTDFSVDFWLRIEVW